MPIYGNHLAWRFGTFAVPCFRAYRDHILADVLSGYATISERAKQVANDAYKQMGARYAGEDYCGDPSDAAEAASEKGQVYYEMMTGMRQATINLHAAGLFHLLEQQLGTLIHHVRNSEHPSRLGKEPPSHIHGYADWICDNLGLNLRDLPQWDTIEELQLVANSVKHAEGKSERQLRAQRPDLFEHPIRAEMGLSGTPAREEPLRLPLAGDGLFVTEKVFAEYSTAVYDFVIAILTHFRENARALYPSGA
jgi:hypothetical protein